VSIKNGITLEGAFRSHVAEMRIYADELAPVLGEDSAIVKRIRGCADNCAHTLDIFEKLAAKKVSA
jgi:hypothetical protein